jgi:hypothetical protein
MCGWMVTCICADGDRCIGRKEKPEKNPLYLFYHLIPGSWNQLVKTIAPLLVYAALSY